MSPIVEKLRKLIAHEQSSRSIGNVEEAQAFAVRIQQMLAEHKLTMSDVESAAIDEADPVGESRTSTTVGTPLWSRVLMDAVARNLYCDILEQIDARGKTRLIIIGRDGDRVAVLELFRYLASVARSCADTKVRILLDHLSHQPESAAWFEDGAIRLEFKGSLDAHFRKWKSDFCFGFAAAIAHRMNAARQDAEKVANVGSLAIVRHEEAAIAQYVSSHFECGASKRPRRRPTNDAMLAGHAAGSRVVLGVRSALEN